MNSIQCNKKARAVGPPASASGLVAGLVFSILLAASSWAADMYRPGTNALGGVPAQATITSITPQGSNTTVCWYGMQGWYTVERSTNNGPPWTAVGTTAASDFATCLTVPTGTNGSAFFRLNQNNAYVGSGACAGCHGDKHSEWVGTAHSGALATLQNIGMGQNSACLPCHTVGFGQPTGYINRTNTPNLTDVGCENCHGPAGWHKYSDHDVIHPAVSIDPAICGGCHSDIHHPTYEEYSTTLHAQVNDDVKYGFNSGVYFPDTVVIGTNTLYGYYVTTNANLTLKTNATTGIVHSGNGPGAIYDPGQDRQAGCGICHSGATRLSMLNDYEARQAGYTNALKFPTAKDSGSWGPTCAICHDPHSAENPGQLRNPLWSTNYYTMPTTADKRTVYTTNFMGGITTNVIFMSAAFANMYDPNIQVCGQCHNSRGARWDGRSFGFITNGGTISYGVTTNISFGRAPHHSPQYNLLSGMVQPDYLNGVYGTNYFGCHSLNTNGCAACHMATKTMTVPTPENPNYTGHEFDPLVPAFVGCTVAGCHDGVTTTVDPTNGLYNLQLEITNNISLLVSNLNRWALLKGPSVFGTNNANRYRENGWEYTAPGALASVTNTGPSATDQLKITNLITQARFNLYMVSYGKSLGIHNPAYARFLLNDASNKVWQASQ